ncbi:zinc finger dhhc domain-containing protein [Cyclospora cayetanensis]|uniref:Zinc finger dhhc domain-containing protein n=1 Tax=Cyclospora cayetanensis TaxID=88456 RepID=A0A1D3CS43_9EIME|nr:zinc finger dhhc domain-containing protein [Cyclospora cayetanensis]
MSGCGLPDEVVPSGRFSCVQLFIDQWTSAYPGWLAALLLGVCLLIDVVFLLVTLDFLAEQWEALETNATLVETYRNTHGQRTTLWEHAVAVFGREWWFWWLPVPPRITPNWTDPEFKDEKEDIQLTHDCTPVPGHELQELASGFSTSRTPANYKADLLFRDCTK